MNEVKDPIKSEIEPSQDSTKPGPGWSKDSLRWAANSTLPVMSHLARASHLVTQKLEAATKMSTSQIRVLFEALDPNGVSQSFLGKRHNVDPASVTRTVQAMERDELIVRQPDPKDNRLMRVFITPKGRALIEAIPPQLLEFEKSLLEGWTENEILQFHGFLARIEQRMDIDQHMKQINQERETA